MIVVLALFWPTKLLDNAGAKAVLDRVNQLSHAFQVTLVVAADREKHPWALGVNSAVRVLTIDVHEPSKTLGRALSFVTRTVLAEIGPEPWRVSMIGRSTVLREALVGADVVEIHWSQWFGLLDIVRRVNPNSYVVAYAHDVMWQGLTRRGRFERSRVRKAASRIGAFAARRREPRVLNNFDKVVTFSAKDVGLLRLLGVRSPIEIDQLPLGDLADGVEWNAADSERVVFVAAMYRPENALGAKWLVDHVWPLVLNARPAARLQIVGSGSPEWLLATQEQGVEVLGFVADLSEVYRGAAVVAVPLLSGAGVKMKVIEGLAAGVPVVTTPVGAEGIPRGLLSGVADDAQDFADAVVRSMTDARLVAQVRDRGLRWIQSRAIVAKRAMRATIEDYSRHDGKMSRT